MASDDERSPLINLDEEWLLIFDNVEDTSLGKLNDFLPTGGKGGVLITSRDPYLEYSFRCRSCKIECFESQEGKDFLMAQIPRWTVEDSQEKDDIVLLTTQLGGLPLAIKQMGSFLRESSCSVTILLDLLKATNHFQEISTNQAIPVDSEYEHTLASVWAVSLSRLDSTALNLLRVLSFLDADGISGFILTALGEFACRGNNDHTCTIATSTLRCDCMLSGVLIVDLSRFYQNIRTLRKYSLIEGDCRSGITIHRLIQATTLHSMPWQDQAAFFRFVTCYIHQGHPQSQATSDTLFDQWGTCACYASHVLRLNKLGKELQIRDVDPDKLFDINFNCSW